MQMSLIGDTRSTAEFSACRRYRYTLTRTWDADKPVVVFLMLNPSTADGHKDDNTIRKCIKLARRWGYGGLIVLNIFAWRSTDPKVLPEVEEPVGPENDAWIVRVCEGKQVVCAWGNHGGLRDRGRNVLRMIVGRAESVCCLKRNQDGSPKHPLYCPDASDPLPYEG